jgi:hypothetical protein
MKIGYGYRNYEKNKVEVKLLTIIDEEGKSILTEKEQSWIENKKQSPKGENKDNSGAVLVFDI